MSRSLRWLAALGLASLTLVGAPVNARQRLGFTGAFSPREPTFSANVNRNPFIAPGLTLQQGAFNTAVIGGTQAQLLRSVGLTGPNLSNVLAAQALSPYSGGPALAPYALSTGAGYNPYLGGGGAAALSASPYGSGYSMSTAGASYTPYGGGGAYGGGYLDPTGAALQGLSSYVDASGKYWINIGQARLIREESRRSAIDTARKQIEFEQWWDRVRPTAPKMREQERITDLDRARKDPPKTEIWSAQALNTLLNSIKSTGKLNRGPNLELPDETLQHINLTDSAARGNVGMLKEASKLSWPLSLQEPQFDKARKHLSRNLVSAVAMLKEKEPIELATLKDINSDFKTLNDTLNSSADDLSPAQYIEAKRFLNQLKSAIKALSDPKAANYFNNTWNAKGKNVAELVDHLTKEGLEFAPAAPGDEAAYNALYNNLRAFEAGVQSANR